MATDCLSEGIDLQYAFNAVIHYDLPWNPNRLEQREGRVDRYGQPSRKVRTAVLYGTNNEMDLTVLRVLIRKARAIYQDLGVTVPVPVDSEAIMESLLEVLFQERGRPGDPEQLALPLLEFQHAWEEAARREKETRSIFAQHGLQRHEVEPELREAEAVLGTPRDVRAFWLDAAQRFELPVQVEGDRVRVPVEALERQHFDLSVLPPGRKAETVELVFDGPAPEGAVLLHRNHPWVEDLAHRVLGEALVPEGRAGLGGTYWPAGRATSPFLGGSRGRHWNLDAPPDGSPGPGPGCQASAGDPALRPRYRRRPGVCQGTVRTVRPGVLLVPA